MFNKNLFIQQLTGKKYKELKNIELAVVLFNNKKVFCIKADYKKNSSLNYQQIAWLK